MAFEFSKNEDKILNQWEKGKIFEKSINIRKKSPNFVFFEGPPTANGKPGIHHLVARCFKDLVCRYKTMRGFRVVRKAGWDTHGLPVEIEVEKKLGLRHKSEIEQYGVDRFNKLCRESVWQYKEEWEKFTKRIGYWVDLKKPYVTYHNSYIESVWSILKRVFRSKQLYKDYRVAPYCPRCGTTLSSHEVSQGYQTVKDNSVYVKFPIKSEAEEFKETSFLVWTTTPWTLPANVAVALNKNIVYIKAKINDSQFVLVAKNRLSVLGDNSEVIKEYKGKDLIGLQYEAPFVALEKSSEQDIYKTVFGEFVSDTDGTGFVHIAPAFGEDDMNLIRDLRDRGEGNFPVLKTVDEEGLMSIPGFVWNKKFVKDADPLIVENLKERNLLFKEEKYEHEYPFCWRCKSPLIYYATPSWFIKTKQIKERLINSNQKVNWYPDHIKDGRFGMWLNEIKDWNLSRNRFWATPLPVWICDNKDCNHQEAIGSLADLMAQSFSDNEILLLRHGFSVALEKRLNCSYPEPFHCPLNAKGKKEIEAKAKQLARTGVDVIYASDLVRAKQTAEIISKTTGAKIIYDSRLRELNVGDFNGASDLKLKKWFSQQIDKVKTKIPNGESYLDVAKRVFNFVNDINKNNQGKKILIVSHDTPLSILYFLMNGISVDNPVWSSLSNKPFIKTGEIKKVKFNVLPFDEDFLLNFHKPYIDNVEFGCPKCHGLMKRSPEVIDCWFDSGSMPFAQNHYPLENKDSIDARPNGNRIFVMRHGHSQRQLSNVSSSWPEKPALNLTNEGVAEVIETVKRLAEEDIDLIISSDLLRTKQTSAIIAKDLNLKVVYDKRLRERAVGEFNGQPVQRMYDFLMSSKTIEERMNKTPKGGESYIDVQKRVILLVKEICKKYKNKNILIVSHDVPIAILEGSLMGLPLHEIVDGRKLGGFEVMPTGDYKEVDLSSLANDKERALRQYPADFICEAVDQTRGWFYTLFAIAMLLGKEAPYKNVISLGHVLDSKGEKMSKSKGNIVDPWQIIEKYGVDAARWYFFTINGPGEPKLFNEKDVDTVVKRFLMTWLNCFVFYETYADKKQKKLVRGNNILDKWILSRLNTLVQDVTSAMDSYDVLNAARILDKFVSDDLSLWYIRRSRKRFQNPSSVKDFSSASATLYHVFSVMTRLCAPFTPFFADEIWQRLNEKNSVHLTNWPIADNKLVNKSLESDMIKTREIITQALSLRAKAAIKVRQPLLSLTINDQAIASNIAFGELIKEEVNVKAVIFGQEMALDTNITPELKEEGIVRDVTRLIQEARKESNLKPTDRISVIFSGEGELMDILKKAQGKFIKEARIAKISFSEVKPAYPIEKQIVLDGKEVLASIKKIK